jgi:osmoprotectant transport system permease protein
MRYLLENPQRVSTAAFEHIKLVAVAMAIAIALAMLIGVYLHRHPKLGGSVQTVLSVIYTIPSIAFLVLLIPLLGLGLVPAVVALVLYAQAILVRNIVAGLGSVEPAVVEAAAGMGLTPWEITWLVELPMAMPLILAGVRVAAVSMIAIATVAAFFDAGGLGALIREGISQDYGDKILAGVILVALVAFGVELSLRYLERRATRYRAGAA